MTEEKYVEDEIDLRDYINVILKRKKVILAVFFVAVITTTIVSLLMPKVYESASLIQLGSIDDLLIKKEEAKEMLLSQNNLETVIKDLNLNIGLKDLKVKIKIEDINGTNLLGIKVQFPDSDKAVKINEIISTHLFSYGQNLYREKITLINERLRELEQDIQNIEVDIKRTQNLISGFSSSSSVSQSEISLRIILLQNTLPNYESQLTILKNQKNNMKMLLAKSNDFKVFDSPIKPSYPINPNKRRSVAIAGVFGLMIGLFLAFFTEYWEKLKQTSNIKPQG